MRCSSLRRLERCDPHPKPSWEGALLLSVVFWLLIMPTAHSEVPDLCQSSEALWRLLTVGVQAWSQRTPCGTGPQVLYSLGCGCCWIPKAGFCPHTANCCPGLECISSSGSPLRRWGHATTLQNIAVPQMVLLGLWASGMHHHFLPHAGSRCSYLLLAALVLHHFLQAFSSCDDQELPSSCDARTYCGGFCWGAPASGSGHQ